MLVEHSESEDEEEDDEDEEVAVVPTTPMPKQAIPQMDDGFEDDQMDYVHIKPVDNVDNMDKSYLSMKEVGSIDDPLSMASW